MHLMEGIFCISMHELQDRYTNTLSCMMNSVGMHAQSFALTSSVSLNHARTSPDTTSASGCPLRLIADNLLIAITTCRAPRRHRLSMSPHCRTGDATWSLRVSSHARSSLLFEAIQDIGCCVLCAPHLDVTEMPLASEQNRRALSEGRRDSGLRLLTMIQCCLQQFSSVRIVNITFAACEIKLFHSRSL